MLLQTETLPRIPGRPLMGGPGHLVVDVLLGDRGWAGLLQPAARGRGGRRIALLLLHVLHVLLVLLLVGLLLLAVLVHLKVPKRNPEPAISMHEYSASSSCSIRFTTKQQGG